MPVSGYVCASVFVNECVCWLVCARLYMHVHVFVCVPATEGEREREKFELYTCACVFCKGLWTCVFVGIRHVERLKQKDGEIRRVKETEQREKEAETARERERWRENDNENEMKIE